MVKTESEKRLLREVRTRLCYMFGKPLTCSDIYDKITKMIDED